MKLKESVWNWVSPLDFKFFESWDGWCLSLLGLHNKIPQKERLKQNTFLFSQFRMATHSSLENPMDRGAWQATVHRVTKSRTGLKLLSKRSSRGWKAETRELARTALVRAPTLACRWLPPSCVLSSLRII